MRGSEEEEFISASSHWVNIMILVLKKHLGSICSTFMSWAEECIDFIKGTNVCAVRLNSRVRDQCGEMKMVTFTLVCAPRQEDPLHKVTVLPTLSV